MDWPSFWTGFWVAVVYVALMTAAWYFGTAAKQGYKKR